MKIFYVHHALREKGNPPTQEDGITEIGRKDAEMNAEIFKEGNKKLNIKAIYSSSFFRCMETARIINKHLNVPIIEDERLNECGSVVMNGEKESWLDCQERIVASLKDIVFENDNDDCVICVTSGVNLTAFVSLSYGIKPSANLPMPMVLSCSPIGFNITKDSFKKIKFQN